MCLLLTDLVFIYMEVQIMISLPVFKVVLLFFCISILLQCQLSEDNLAFYAKGSVEVQLNIISKLRLEKVY